MSKEKEQILEGLKKAMQSEVEGHHFYKMAGEKTKDEKGKAAFESLANDEMLHLNFLKAQFKSIEETGAVDLNAQLGDPGETVESPIFSDDFKSRLKEADYEMTALSIGAQLELSAIHFYRGEADKASDPSVQSFYNELAEWEGIHLKRLMDQQNELQQDYWYASNFYPF